MMEPRQNFGYLHPQKWMNSNSKRKESLKLSLHPVPELNYLVAPYVWVIKQECLQEPLLYQHQQEISQIGLVTEQMYI